MRYVKLPSMVLGMVMIATVVSAKECNPIGKGALPVGATPPGIGTGSGYVYSRQYVRPAPVISTEPATTGRRAFSTESAAAAAAAPATAAPAKTADEGTKCYRQMAREQIKVMPKDLFYGGMDSNEPRVISGTAE
jgi:hypothetical protein